MSDYDTDAFDTDAFGLEFAPLLAIDRERPLDRGLPDRAWRDQLDQLSVESAFEHTVVVDEQAALACLAGVWLLHDFLDESHSISQSLATAEGSFWHGIMHRREGDFGNAKYWFGRVGDHPVFTKLAERLGGWDACGFVDRCQKALRTGAGTGAGVEACTAAQQAEWEALFDDCYRRAIGSA